MVIGLLCVSVDVNLFPLQEYRVLFEESSHNPMEKTLEDKFFEHEAIGFCISFILWLYIKNLHKE